jgi:hypothetical protein
VHTQGGEAALMVEEAPTEAAVKGGAPSAATQEPRRRPALREHRPLSSFFLGPSRYCRGALLLGYGSQGGGKFAAMGGASRKLGFWSICSVGGFVRAIISNYLDPRALGHL